MFQKTRIRLAAWYLLIIMVISISFSVAIYRVLASELNRVERIQRLRTEDRLPERPRMILPNEIQDGLQRTFLLDPDLIKETKNRLAIILVAINMVILGSSAAVGYFLAGRTLKPIKNMLDEQNRFITDASHELRTPLTSLKSEIEVNLRDKRLTITEAKKLLKSNLEEVNNLQVLSDGLIKLTQYQKNNNDLTFTEVSLDSIIKEAVRKVAILAKNKNITIVNNARDFQIEGDEQLLCELFVIFLDNAIKYSREKTKVRLKTEKSDGHVLIHIIDEGMGIKSGNIHHLFERFYRSDKSRTKTDVAGYGLGLAIAKEIVSKHNGSINVKSKVGQGTTFVLKLPIKHR